MYKGKGKAKHTFFTNQTISFVNSIYKCLSNQTMSHYPYCHHPDLSYYLASVLTTPFSISPFIHPLHCYKNDSTKTQIWSFPSPFKITQFPHMINSIKKLSYLSKYYTLFSFLHHPELHLFVFWVYHTLTTQCFMHIFSSFRFLTHWSWVITSHPSMPSQSLWEGWPSSLHTFPTIGLGPLLLPLLLSVTYRSASTVFIHFPINLPSRLGISCRK